MAAPSARESRRTGLVTRGRVSRRFQSVRVTPGAKRQLQFTSSEPSEPGTSRQAKRQRLSDTFGIQDVFGAHELYSNMCQHVFLPEKCAAALPPTDFPERHREAMAAIASTSFVPSTTCCHVAPIQEFWDRYSMSDRVFGTGQFGCVRECTYRYTGERLACKVMKKAKEAFGVTSTTGGVQSAAGGMTSAAGGMTSAVSGMASMACEMTSLTSGLMSAAGGQPITVADVEREASLLSRLAGHGGVVQFKGLYEGADEIFLVLELCDGGDLFDEIMRRQRFGEKEAAEIFAQIAGAVGTIHAENIFHGDLKPENILLSRGSNPNGELTAKISDFGLAKQMEPGQTLKGMAGSPFYMAPEVLTSEYDKRADLWSLGVILYILLSGSPPFWGENDAEVFRAIQVGELPFSCHPWECVSHDAKGLVRSLLSTHPNERPSPEAAIAHPWVQRHLVDSKNSSATPLLGFGADTSYPNSAVPGHQNCAVYNFDDFLNFDTSYSNQGVSSEVLLQDVLCELLHPASAVVA